MNNTSQTTASQANKEITSDDPDTPSQRMNPCSFFNYNNNAEAKAWAYDVTALGCFISGSVFLATSLLQLALNEAGCLDLPAGVECTQNVYGMKPSSFLTTMTTISGFLSAILMPIVGAMVDHTSYRLQVARVTGGLVWLINIVQAIVNERTWFAVAILQTINPVVFMIHTTVVMAYLSELTSDEELLTRYNSSYLALRSIAMLVTLALIFGISILIPSLGPQGSLSRDVGMARVGQVTMCVLSGPLLYLAFRGSGRGLGERRPKSQVPPGASLLTTGFKKLFKTFCQIAREYRALKWNIVANVFYMSLMTALPTVAITYTTTFLRLNATMSGIVFGVFIVSAIVGSVCTPHIIRLLGMLRALKLAILLFVVSIIIMTLAIRGPDQIGVFFFFTFAWGFIFGWIVPTGRLIYLNIMPKGQETEMMGIYLFSSNGFVWLPPLVITILNENGIPVNLGILALAGFGALAMVCLFLMGDYKKAVELAKSTEPTTVAVDEESGEIKEIEMAKPDETT